MERKTILITGSSRGIGKSIAEKFAQNNFNIILNCKNSFDELFATEKELKAYNKNVLSIKADVSNYLETERLFSEASKYFGDIDILVNNAGISYIGLFNLMEENNWKEIIATNLNSVINCSHIAVQSMIKNKSGIIINISSFWGEIGASCEVIYSATKSAVNGFTKSLAKELAPSGIRVNAVSCGAIDTSMNNSLTIEEKNMFVENIPIGRFGKGSEIADLVYFLTSPESSYITAQVINIDGGF